MAANDPSGQSAPGRDALPGGGGVRARARGASADLAEPSDALVPSFPIHPTGTGLVLFDSSPGELSAIWWLARDEIEHAAAGFPADGGRPEVVVRLTRRRPEGGFEPVADRGLGIGVLAGTGESDFRVPADHGYYRAELGLGNKAGGWLMLARSNGLHNVASRGIALPRLRRTPVLVVAPRPHALDVSVCGPSCETLAAAAPVSGSEPQLEPSPEPLPEPLPELGSESWSTQRMVPGRPDFDRAPAPVPPFASDRGETATSLQATGPPPGHAYAPPSADSRWGAETIPAPPSPPSPSVPQRAPSPNDRVPASQVPSAGSLQSRAEVQPMAPWGAAGSPLPADSAAASVPAAFELAPAFASGGVSSRVIPRGGTQSAEHRSSRVPMQQSGERRSGRPASGFDGHRMPPVRSEPALDTPLLPEMPRVFPLAPVAGTPSPSGAGLPAVPGRSVVLQGVCVACSPIARFETLLPSPPMPVQAVIERAFQPVADDNPVAASQTDPRYSAERMAEPAGAGVAAAILRRIEPLRYEAPPERPDGLEIMAELKIYGRAAPGKEIDLFGFRYRVGPGGRFQLSLAVDDPALIARALAENPPRELVREEEDPRERSCDVDQRTGTK